MNEWNTYPSHTWFVAVAYAYSICATSSTEMPSKETVEAQLAHTQGKAAREETRQ